MKVKFTTNIDEGLLKNIKILAIEKGTNVNTIIENLLKEYIIKESMKMKKYYVNFGTGEGNEEADTLDEAMELAVEGATYTQDPIIIAEDGEEIARLPWYGVKAEEDDIITVDFGDYGFYGEWQES